MIKASVYTTRGQCYQVKYASKHSGEERNVWPRTICRLISSSQCSISARGMNGWKTRKYHRPIDRSWCVRLSNFINYERPLSHTSPHFKCIESLFLHDFGIIACRAPQIHPSIQCHGTDSNSQYEASYSHRKRFDAGPNVQKQLLPPSLLVSFKHDVSKTKGPIANQSLKTPLRRLAGVSQGLRRPVHGAETARSRRLVAETPSSETGSVAPTWANREYPPLL